jgi:D-arabinose 1-dehydrogenase-like Zn-dependent alcohol dehydrogenase
MDKMKAAVLTAFNRPLEIREIPLPPLKPDEVRLKVLSAGICSTDLHIQAGKMSFIKLPHVPGHEILGVAVEPGAQVNAAKTTRIQPGARYLAGIDVVCGTCFYCRTGRANLCSSRERLGFERYGGFAEYVNVPARNLIPFPAELPAAQGAIIPDAVACMVHTLVDQGHIHKGQRIVLIGLGGLGFQGIQIARHFGAQVIATSRSQKKIDTGLRLGAKAVCPPTLEAIRANALDIWGAPDADIVIDNIGTPQATGSHPPEISRPVDIDIVIDNIGAPQATGSHPPEISRPVDIDIVIDNIGTPETIALSLDLVRRGGKVLVVGYEDFHVPVHLYDLMLNEKELIGVRGSTLDNLRASVELTVSGDITPFVSNEYAFEDINQALEDLHNGRVMSRAVVNFAG